MIGPYDVSDCQFIGHRVILYLISTFAHQRKAIGQGDLRPKVPQNLWPQVPLANGLSLMGGSQLVRGGNYEHMD